MKKYLIAVLAFVLAFANISAVPMPEIKAAIEAPPAEYRGTEIVNTEPSRAEIEEEKELASIEETSSNSPEIPDSSTCNECLQVKNTMTMLATGYCGCMQCCGKDDRITATGVRATEGRTIAADPRVLPYGTHVLINGHEYVVEDCGGAITGNRIDIYFENHDVANTFDPKYVEVVVLN